MSLDWSAMKVKNWDAINTEENWPRIKTVAMDTMAVGINPITEANYKEFHRRQLLFRMALGYGYTELLDFAKQMPLEFVHSMVGLGTNASTKSITKFNKDLITEMDMRVNQFTRHPTEE